VALRLAGRRRLGVAPAIAAAALLAYFYAEVPHAYANLIESRELMGTHAEANYSPQEEKWLFAAEVTRRTRPTDRVISHYGNLGSRKEMWYYLDRSLDEINHLSQVDQYKKTWSRSVVILDERLLGPSERSVFQRLIHDHPAYFFDRYAMIDLRSESPGITSYAFSPLPMSRAYRWFVSHKYPPMTLTRSGYLPGICAGLDGGVPIARDEAPPPAPPKSDLKSRTCYANYLAQRGDSSGAARQINELADGLARRDQSLGAAQLLAAGTIGMRLRVLLRADGPQPGDVRYRVTRGAAVTHVARSPLLPPPPTWRAGMMYLDEVAIGPPADQVTLELTRPGTPRKQPIVVIRPPPPEPEVVQSLRLIP
jgi:hypothetical protein